MEQGLHGGAASSQFFTTMEEDVLQVTQAAAEQVTAVRKASGLPNDFALRVFEEVGDAGTPPKISLTFAALPAEDDAVMSDQGLTVFVSSELVDPLSSQALDVQETPQGTALVLTSRR